MILTGFEGYGGRGVNPAEEIIKVLDGQSVGDVGISGRILPVTYRGLRQRLHDIVRDEKPDALISLGLWPGEPVIRLERFAVNLNAFEIPDNEGHLDHDPIAASNPLAYPATLPVEEIQARLLSVGIPARLSSSAGNFLCNAAMYCGLEALEQARLDIPCGFMHVPYLPTQVAAIIEGHQASHSMELHQRADLASMSLDLMVEAVRLAIETTFQNSE